MTEIRSGEYYKKYQHRHHHISRRASTPGHRPPHRFPKGPVGSGLHPAFSCGLYQVVCPPCGWTSYAALAEAWSPYDQTNQKYNISQLSPNHVDANKKYIAQSYQEKKTVAKKRWWPWILLMLLPVLGYGCKYPSPIQCV